MYNLDELSKKSNIGKNILQRYRKSGVLKDKVEIREYFNNLTKTISKRKVFVYDEDDLNKIMNYNFIAFNGETIYIPKDINVYIISSRLKCDDERKNNYVDQKNYCYHHYTDGRKIECPIYCVCGTV